MVGGNIRTARIAKGWSQHQLATQVETSISRVSGWERGEHLPSPTTQLKLVAELFDGDKMAMFREEVAA